MAGFIEKMLNSLKLTDEDDDFDDDEDMETTRPRETKKEAVTSMQERQPAAQPPRRFESRPMRSAQPSYREEEEVYEPRRMAVRPERQPVPMRSASQGLEVSIMKPSNFDDSKDICDMLKEERAIIINLEGIESDQAQRMMDFISGAIYSLDAKIHQISGFVFCISPAKVDISGDYIDMLSENNGFQIPNLSK